MDAGARTEGREGVLERWCESGRCVEAASPALGAGCDATVDVSESVLGFSIEALERSQNQRPRRATERTRKMMRRKGFLSHVGRFRGPEHGGADAASQASRSRCPARMVRR